MEKVILKSISAYSDEIDELPINYKDSWLLHRKYVEFCKQPLNLGMFVPAKIVDGVWVVLEEPTQEKYGWYSASHFEEESGWMCEGGEEAYYEALKEYQEAKDRVLFEGWELVSNCRWGAEIAKDKITGALQFNISKYKTVEQLFMERNLFLTPTAQKQIGL